MNLNKSYTIPKKQNKKGRIFILAFSLCLGIAAVATREVLPASLIYYKGVECLNYDITWFSFPNILLFVITALFSYVILIELSKLLRNADLMTAKKPLDPKRIFLISFILNVLVYDIWFLEFFPGTGMNDTINALMNPSGTASQPYVYQYLIYYSIEIFSKLFGGNYTYAYACVSFLQLLLMSAAIAWVVSWMAKKEVRCGVIYFFMAFYAIFPAFGNYSIALVKDIPFGLAVMILSVMIYDIVDSKGDNLKKIPVFIGFITVLTILCCIRSNGRFIAFFTGIILLILLKSNRARVVCAYVPVILIFALLLFGENRFGTNNVSFRESIGVPIAQISAVLNERGEMSKEDRETLENIMPQKDWRDGYEFSFSDTIKFNPKFDNDWLNENKGIFLRTWASILRDNFPTYVQAYLFHSYGFWSISPYNDLSTDYSQSYFTKINNNTGDDSLWGTFIEGLGLENRRIFPLNIHSAIYYLFGTSFQYSLKFSPGMMIWIVFAFIALLLAAKRYKYVIPFLPVMITWLTMMVASPISLIYRYSFYLIVSLPCLAIITLIEYEKNEDQAGEERDDASGK